jgi:pimeloyl-ACP methyl ester carboxylesterase
VTVPPAPDLDDVLEAFGSEPATDDATLADYIRLYPQFAPALADFAHELRLTASLDGEAANRDDAWQTESWRRFAAAAEAMPGAAAGRAIDPFSDIAAPRLAEIRRSLNVPAAVLNGFRDRLVVAASVPRRFIGELAAALNVALADFETFLELPPRRNPAASYKADAAPGPRGEKVSFEVLLDQAMVTPERRRDLLNGHQ